MNKDILEKAIILNFQEKMLEINTRIEDVANTQDFRSMANCFRDAAELVETTADQLDELEEQDEDNK